MILLYSYVGKPLVHQMRPGLSTQNIIRKFLYNQIGQLFIFLNPEDKPSSLASVLTSLLLLLAGGSRSHLHVMLSHVHIPAPTLREGLPTDLTLMRLLS